MTLVSTVGGAAGPLYGTLFLRMGSSYRDLTVLGPHDFAQSLRAGVDGVVARGHAELGDKTMYDALAPAVDSLEGALASGSNLAVAARSAADAASSGRDATAPLVARKGRASYLGERSIGHQDPGSASAALLLEAFATSFASS